MNVAAATSLNFTLVAPLKLLPRIVTSVPTTPLVGVNEEIDGGKIGKSVGNVIYLSEIVEQGFPALAFRYLLLGAHYRTPASFSWDTLKAAQMTLYRLYNHLGTFQQSSDTNGKSGDAYKSRFWERINDDLDTPGALAVMWDLIKDINVSASAKATLLKDFDRVLGLSLEAESAKLKVSAEDLDENIKKLVNEREQARKAKDWKRADALRLRIEEQGFSIEDTDTGPRAIRK